MADLNVSLVLRAIDRLSAPVRKAARTVGTLSREGVRAGRSLGRAGAGAEQFARAEGQMKRATAQATGAIVRQHAALRRLARMREQAARRLRGAGLRRAGHLAAGGAAATAGAYGVKRMVEAVVSPLREVEKAKGELAALGVKNMQAWTAAARQAQGRISGIMAADFLRAGYDIKSALSSLTDEAAASMTTAVVWTAKATKASAQEMAPLFASAYGIFKRQYKGASDAQFGDMTAGMVAAAVKTFKTTGAAMRQALQSAGGGAANAGMGMGQQFAVLGMLQTTMEPGMAGTALKAYAAKAAAAQQRLGKMGRAINLLDKNGMLRDMADVMAQFRRAFGKTLDAREAAQIQKAFGSEEAVRLISALWGQEKALRANVKIIKKAGKAGRQAAITMAMQGMDNLDDRLVLLGQKWNLLKQQMGAALAPMINRLVPALAAVIDKMSQLISAHPRLAAGLGAVVVALGAMLAVAGPLMMALSSMVGSFTMLAFAMRMMRAAKLRGMAAEILEVGAAMDSVARKKWRLPRLIWRMAIAPLRWAMFIPRLAWRAFIAPLRWAGGLISRIPWAGLAGRLSWGMLVRPLAWGAGLISRVPWVSLAGKLGWGALIRPLSWGLRFIPVIGWAALAGQLAWDLLIKPLGWDKYVSVQGLKMAWARIKGFFAGIDWGGMIKRIDWANVALLGLPGVVARIVRAFTGIDLTAAGRKIMASLWDGLKSVAAGLLKWAAGVAGKIASALRISAAPPGSAPAARGAKMPQAGRAAAMAAARQKKASGGWMRPGLPTLVGERGPELIYPSRAGWVASNDNLRRAMNRVIATRREMARLAAAASVAGALVSLPAQMQPAAARQGVMGAVQARPVHSLRPVNMTVHITVNARTDADAREIARQVDAHLRRASRSMLGDLENGGAA